MIILLAMSSGLLLYIRIHIFTHTYIQGEYIYFTGSLCLHQELRGKVEKYTLMASLSEKKICQREDRLRPEEHGIFILFH